MRALHDPQRREASPLPLVFPASLHVIVCLCARYRVPVRAFRVSMRVIVCSSRSFCEIDRIARSSNESP
jgi:hypothetical protein